MKLTCCYIATILCMICHYSLYAQSKEDSIVVLPLKMTVPANANKIGSIKLGNNATEIHCDYEEIITAAKKRAIEMGGNVVKITELTPPAFISKCYKIKADVYYSNKLPDSLFKHLALKNIQFKKEGAYATLYIYRLPDTVMLAASYSIHLNDDSVICTVRSKSRDSVNIYKEGPQILWAKTEQREELKLNIKFGEVYYIRCGLKDGQFRKMPVMELIDEKTGRSEYAKGKKARKDQSVKYLQEIH